MGKFFVTGATGAIGQHLCKLLAENGHSVHALTRDTSSASAQKLADHSSNITLFQGSFDELENLTAAATGCGGVFLNLSPNLKEREAERRHARNVIEICTKVGIKTCVYLSSVAVGPHASWPDWIIGSMIHSFWLDKNACQEYVKAAGFEHWSILQPATFMSNFAGPLTAFMYPKIQDEPVGSLVSYNSPNTSISLVDPRDIARFALAALTEPGRFHEQILMLESDHKTIVEIAEQLSDISGKKIEPSFVSAEQKLKEATTNPFVTSARWIDEVASHLDYSPQERYGIPVTSFEKYLEREKDEVLNVVWNTGLDGSKRSFYGMEKP